MLLFHPGQKCDVGPNIPSIADLVCVSVMYGSWFENIKRWDKLIQGRNDLQIFHLRFEDLKIVSKVYSRRKSLGIKG